MVDGQVRPRGTVALRGLAACLDIGEDKLELAYAQPAATRRTPDLRRTYRDQRFVPFGDRENLDGRYSNSTVAWGPEVASRTECDCILDPCRYSLPQIVQEHQHQLKLPERTR